MPCTNDIPVSFATIIARCFTIDTLTYNWAYRDYIMDTQVTIGSYLRCRRYLSAAFFLSITFRIDIHITEERELNSLSSGFYNVTGKIPYFCSCVINLHLISLYAGFNPGLFSVTTCPCHFPCLSFFAATRYCIYFPCS